MQCLYDTGTFVKYVLKKNKGKGFLLKATKNPMADEEKTKATKKAYVPKQTRVFVSNLSPETTDQICFNASSVLLIC